MKIIFINIGVAIFCLAAPAYAEEEITHILTAVVEPNEIQELITVLNDNMASQNALLKSLSEQIRQSDESNYKLFTLISEQIDTVTAATKDLMLARERNLERTGNLAKATMEMYQALLRICNQTPTLNCNAHDKEMDRAK